MPECPLIEPTETERKETLNVFVEAMAKVQQEAKSDGDLVRGAPHTVSVRRLDDVKAVRELDVRWQAGANS